MQRLSFFQVNIVSELVQNGVGFRAFTWGCRALRVGGGCRGPSGRSCSSLMECLKCWSVWWCCCLGSEGRSAVCEWEYAWEMRDGYREWHIENLEFRQLVRHHLLSSGCVAEQLIREMSSVMYASFLSALTGAFGETGCGALHSDLTLRLGTLITQYKNSSVVTITYQTMHKSLILGYYYCY